MPRKPRRKRFSRAEMQAEIEELSDARYVAAARADQLARDVARLVDERNHEARMRRAAEDASSAALRDQRVAEARLLALLDLHLRMVAQPLINRLRAAPPEEPGIVVGTDLRSPESGHG